MKAAAVPSPAPKLRCAIYTRKSSDEGLEQEFNSLDAQRDACEAYVLSQAGEGWQVHPERYDDGGFSGGNIQRPGLQRLLRDVEAGRVQVVVLYKVDRLTRSLGDFSKIVEVLDRAGASFVSVTQAFNTTTSMGRLTLNMLLSFAQFEREVTGERIRDKIAASKRKGMWMGGPPPLGYDPDGRTLKPVEAEAEVVRMIFRRYLELPSVTPLIAELKGSGAVSKRWVMKSGAERGGKAFDRGGVYYLLSNRIYLGEIPHKGASYKGQHAAIVDAELFEAVQKKLLANGGDKRRARAGLPPRDRAPLAGLLFDDGGYLLTPTTTRKANATSYRYYAAAGPRKGRAATAVRLPAEEIEALIRDRVGRFLGDAEGHAWPELRRLVSRITVSPRQLHIAIDRASVTLHNSELDAVACGLPAGDELVSTSEAFQLTCAVSLRACSRSQRIVGPNGSPATRASTVDLVLMKALIRAEAWKRELLAGDVATLEELATRDDVKRVYARRMLRLAFLSPRLKRLILEGRPTPGLTLQKLMTSILPDNWLAQEMLILA